MTLYGCSPNPPPLPSQLVVATTITTTTTTEVYKEIKLKAYVYVWSPLLFDVNEYMMSTLQIDRHWPTFRVLYYNLKYFFVGYVFMVSQLSVTKKLLTRRGLSKRPHIVTSSTPPPS